MQISQNLTADWDTIIYWRCSDETLWQYKTTYYDDFLDCAVEQCTFHGSAVTCILQVFASVLNVLDC